MNSIRREKSNYSIFLLSLLLIEFVSFFFRANSLPNLGVWIRMGIFGFIISNFLLIVLVQTLNNCKNAKIISCALVFWIYSLIIYFITNQIDFIEVLNLTSWIAVLYLFYYYGFPKSKKGLMFIVSAFIIIFSLLYYRYAINGGFIGDKPGVVNAVYYLALSMPFITLMDHKIFRNVMLVLVAVLVVLSQKSTAILIVLITLLIHFLFVKKGNKKSSLRILGSFFAFVFVLFLISHFSGIDILSVFNEDVDSSGNGRFEIWQKVFKEFNGGGFFQKIFGYGLNFSVHVTKNSAHCDFIEILSAFGLVGFILFFRWFLCFIKTILAYIKKDSYLSTIGLIVFAQVTFIMMFSTTIFISNYFLLLMAILGMLVHEMLTENGEISCHIPEWRKQK